MAPERRRLVAFALLLWARTAHAADPPGAPPAPPWGRPFAIARLGYTAPYALSIGGEAYAHERVSVGTDLSISPLGVTYGVSAHYWPRLSRGQGRRHQFLLGLGGDFVASGGVAAGGFSALTAPTIDLRYLARPWRRVGFVAGVRLGVGVAFNAHDFHGARPIDSFGRHVGLVTMLYVGIAIGSRRSPPIAFNGQ